MTGGNSMDVISLDEWELLPDQGSSFFMEECTVFCDEEEAMKQELPSSQGASGQHPVTEFKDIGIVQTEPMRGELASKVTEVMLSDAEEEEEGTVKSLPGAKEVCEEDEVMVEAATDDLHDEEEEGVEIDRAELEGVVGFSVGKLRVNGVGALCSFGVAAATFWIFLIGGRPQQHPQQQRKVLDQKSQFEVFADDKRIHRAVEQASRLNQAVSSVMEGACASTRATVSFGGHYYNGF